MSERRQWRGKAPPVEIDGRARGPLGLAPREFLAQYWQKHPLLIRKAFAGFVSPVAPNDLAGVACEAGSNARLVVHQRRGDRWRVQHGPLAAEEFPKLPKRDWTLLVQDCDKWFADVGALLRHFDFVPSWRLDDIMISYAVPGGSVGAHVDQYDVFLLQGMGRREWQISTDPAAPKACRDGVELKLLREFTATHTWTLEPGDMLYLPPGVPHHGVAVDECLTYSIGMRAPAVSELLTDFTGFVAERLGEEARYADPDLEPPKRDGEIGDAVLARVAQLLGDASRAAPELMREWFPRFITRYRAAFDPAPARRRIDAARVQARLARGEVLHRSPWSRMAWLRRGKTAQLTIAGQAYACSGALAAQLCGNARLDAAALGELASRDLDALVEILNAGHLVLARD